MKPMFDATLKLFPDQRRVCLKGPINWDEPVPSPDEQSTIVFAHLEQDGVVAVAPPSETYLCPDHRDDRTPDGRESREWWAVATVVGDGELREGEATAIAKAVIWTPAGWDYYEWEEEEEEEEEGRTQEPADDEPVEIQLVRLEFPGDGQDPYRCGP